MGKEPRVAVGKILQTLSEESISPVDPRSVKRESSTVYTMTAWHNGRSVSSSATYRYIAIYAI